MVRASGPRASASGSATCGRSASWTSTSPPASVLGLLGHNGAGKTTAVRILTTLAVPTTGSAQVAGHDVVADADAVRASIGLAAQAATVDGLLTARRNLELVGRLYHLPRAGARRRADELLERLDLADAADRLVQDVLGRHAPPARSRRHARGRAARCCSSTSRPPGWIRTAATTCGTCCASSCATGPRSSSPPSTSRRPTASPTTSSCSTTAAPSPPARPDALKARIGGERIDVKVAALEDLPAGEAALTRFADGPSSIDAESLIVTVPVVAGTSLLEVVRELDAAGVAATDVHRREATLDDVFLSLTTKVAA